MSSGGLVSALSGCKKTMNFTWIGWPGQDVSGSLCSSLRRKRRSGETAEKGAHIGNREGVDEKRKERQRATRHVFKRNYVGERVSSDMDGIGLDPFRSRPTYFKALWAQRGWGFYNGNGFPLQDHLARVD